MQCRNAIVVILGVFLWVAPVSAQETESASAAEQAAAHYQAEEWKQAATAYERVVNEEPANGRAWLRLALSR
jgi:hypothetical protein